MEHPRMLRSATGIQTILEWERYEFKLMVNAVNANSKIEFEYFLVNIECIELLADWTDSNG